MEQRFPTIRFRNRPWLLLWLLPFVLLNFAGETLHNHAIFPAASSASQSAERGHSQHADSPHHPSLENARLDAACLACQWHAFSFSGLHSNGAFLAPTSSEPLRVLATAFPPSRAATAPLSRGPPISFAPCRSRAAA